MKANKVNLDLKIHERMPREKLYGTTTLGARGQVVIPAEARKDLALKPGDQILVLGQFGKVLGLIKANQLTEIVKILMSHWSGTGMEKVIKNRVEKIFGDFLKNK